MKPGQLQRDRRLPGCLDIVEISRLAFTAGLPTGNLE
jgi:hypothetical protein